LPTADAADSDINVMTDESWWWWWWWWWWWRCVYCVYQSIFSMRYAEWV